MPETHLTDVALKSFGLSPALNHGLEDAGFSLCTPIQARTLPLALEGRDVAGRAQTGTGKTAAFLLAAMHHLLKFSEPAAEQAPPRQPRALVLAPTRELAIQIHRDAGVLGKYTGLRMTVAYGGTGYESQREQIERGVDLLIGTPGRLIDYFKQGTYTLRHIEVVVLDEADRMFDLGFIADVRYLLRRMPSAGERLNMLFSATMSMRVHELAYEHMNAPAVVDVEPEQVTVPKTKQYLYHVGTHEKIALLLGLLRRAGPGRKLVFVNTRRAAEQVADYLIANGLDTATLSGDIPQKQRERLLTRFARGDLPILVATDVAARGLHIPDVTHVVNFDLPQDAEDYVHRIGRTARAGQSGEAISLACEHYVYSLPDIEAYIGQKLEIRTIDETLLVEVTHPARRPRVRRGSHPAGRSSPRRGPGAPQASAAGTPQRPAKTEQRRDDESERNQPVAANEARNDGGDSERPRTRRRRRRPSQAVEP